MVLPSPTTIVCPDDGVFLRLGVMTQPSVLVTRAVFPEVVERLKQQFEVESNQEDRELGGDELARRLRGKDGVFSTIGDCIDAGLIAATPSLKVISNMAVGHNNIDLVAATRAGIMVTNTPDVLTETTADLAWALLLATARRITEAEAWLRAGEWRRWAYDTMIGVDIHGGTLGIIGMGRIGQAIARRSIGFNMQVLYHNRSRLSPEVEARANNARHVTKDELLCMADHVVLALPYSPQVHHTIGATELALMKPSAILVNIARGGIVDDAALVEALRNGRIAAAGLDVFENEPALHPGFMEQKNVVLTPHIGSASLATRLAMANLAADNLIAALGGNLPPNLVNPSVRPAV